MNPDQDAKLNSRGCLSMEQKEEHGSTLLYFLLPFAFCSKSGAPLITGRLEEKVLHVTESTVTRDEITLTAPLYPPPPPLPLWLSKQQPQPLHSAAYYVVHMGWKKMKQCSIKVARVLVNRRFSPLSLITAVGSGDLRRRNGDRIGCVTKEEGYNP